MTATATITIVPLAADPLALLADELLERYGARLPLLDEPAPPSMGRYANEHTRRWADKIAEFDGYVFVTPEYNHGTSAALKNAIDFLFREWNDKAAGFIGYGGAGGVRAVRRTGQPCGPQGG